MKDHNSKGAELSLMQEIAILKSLDHPNIVKLNEFFTDERYYYLVTEFVEGGELFDEITRRKFMTERTAAHIMKQLLSTIVYCHKRKIVHRDLKPENILIVKSDKKDQLDIKVIDFGTAETFKSRAKLREFVGTAYYMSPEVIAERYTEKCDVWSCGVILYILLSGYPPFGGRDDNTILRAIKRGKFDYDDRVWTFVSKEAKDLINRMLVSPETLRLSAEEAAAHKWIQSFNSDPEKPEVIREILENLNKFQAGYKLQQAALMYLATQVMSEADKGKLQNIFMAMDTNKDGKLSREELINGFTSFGEPHAKAVSRVNEILANLDTDKNGYIGYSEFLMALMDKKQMLSKKNLMQAFNTFDKDKDGYIVTSEIRALLGIGQDYSEETWAEIVSEIDKNQDGKISFSEFEAMMKKFLH
eukprot:TRINITY_DN748_c0_g13_i1.p1 TRINITY_DN748_c0_g13~~TRINITY_DN748_c0_g13_i1.p1  ORF type:complete len:416 (-),score=149.56 TRINITY_DN748_c0_g13_i1:109-1356(-)